MKMFAAIHGAIKNIKVEKEETFLCDCLKGLQA